MRAVFLALSAVFVVSLSLFWFSAAPWLTYHDSGEYALAAGVGGIPHAPGAPTYCLLAWGFVSVAHQLVPQAEAAYLTNLFSGLCGAITLTLAGALAGRVCRRLFAHALAPWLPFFVVPALLLASPGFVEQACVTEQYTLLTALLVAALLVVDVARDAAEPQRQRYQLLLGLLVGLAIGNHPSQLILLPLLLLTGRGTARSLLGLVAGLLVFLYLPLRSRVDPVIDMGNIETWPRLLWALRREQWQTRPLSEAPPGFVAEWLASYDFLQQLGPVGIALALAGAVVLKRRHPRALLLLLGMGASYGGGLLVAHLRQRGIDLAYLRGYGVVDWHIPLYTLGALLAGVGAAALVEWWPKAQRLVLALSAALVLWGALQASGPLSLRSFAQPRTFVSDVLQPLPSNALLVTTGDNLSLTLGYLAYGSQDASRFAPRWVLWGQTPSLVQIEQALQREGTWTPEAQAAFLQRIATETPPYHAPRLTPERAAQSPLFVEYAAGHARAARFLRPAGWLFEVCHQPITDTEAQETERALQQRWPALFRPGTGKENRLEREARGLMHQNRAAYFFERQLWAEAAAAYALSCTYLDHNGSAWFCLGAAYENLGEDTKAQEAYLKAIESEPALAGPRVNLGTLLAKKGHLPEAEALLQEEVQHHPESHMAAANLQLVRQQMRK